MRHTARHEGMNNNNDSNDVIKAIDAQLTQLVAPQYGVMGRAPDYTPPPPAPKGRRNRHPFQSKLRQQSKRNAVQTAPAPRQTQAAHYDLSQARTRTLKLHLDIIRAELNLGLAGKEQFSWNEMQAMWNQKREITKILGQRNTRRLAA